MVDDWSSSAAFRDVGIVGGGCYGAFYTGQLLRAAERARVRFRQLLVVDRDPQCRVAREIGQVEGVTLVTQDWGEFFDQYLTDAASIPESGTGDAIVPSPLMPHL